MATGSADLHKSLQSIWNATTLNDTFKAYWPGGDLNEFPVLSEVEAEAAQPFPYCIYEFEEPTVSARTSSAGSSKLEIRDVALKLTVQAKAISTASAKTIASHLAEEILKVFGGHPTQQSSVADAIDMDHGSILQIQYDRDFPVRSGDEEYTWVLKYNFKLDVPVTM